MQAPMGAPLPWSHSSMPSKDSPVPRRGNSPPHAATLVPLQSSGLENRWWSRGWEQSGARSKYFQRRSELRAQAWLGGGGRQCRYPASVRGRGACGSWALPRAPRLHRASILHSPRARGLAPGCMGPKSAAAAINTAGCCSPPGGGGGGIARHFGDAWGAQRRGCAMGQGWGQRPLGQAGLHGRDAAPSPLPQGAGLHPGEDGASSCASPGGGSIPAVCLVFSSCCTSAGASRSQSPRASRRRHKQLPGQPAPPRGCAPRPGAGAGAGAVPTAQAGSGGLAP